MGKNQIEYYEYWRSDIRKWVKKLPKSFKDKLVKVRIIKVNNNENENI